MDWGELWDYPFDSLVWTTVWTGFGAVGTTAAAFVAAVAYARGRRNDKWAQASLIFYELGSGEFVVNNGSDRSIVNVRATPEYRSVWSAARSRSFHDRTVFVSDLFGVSDYQMYRRVKKTQRAVRRDKRSIQSCMFAREIKAGGSAAVGGAWIHQNGAKGYIRFVDAHGQSWRYDIEGQQLKPTKSRQSPLKLRNRTLWAIYWIFTNELVYIWRRHLYYPCGRPPSDRDQ